jgi:hypothetical protein
MSIALNGSSQYLHRSSPILTAVPFGVVAWIKPAVSSGGKSVFAMSDIAGTSNYWRLEYDEVAGFLSSEARSGGSAQEAFRSGVTEGDWNVVGGLWLGSASRYAYLGATAGTENTGAAGPTGLDNTTIGLLLRSSPTQYFNGDIAEVAIWDLTSWGADAAARKTAWDAAMADFAANKAPSFYTTGLQGYWKLDGDALDYSGNGRDMTLVGSPSYSTHPSITYPGGGPSLPLAALIEEERW